MKNINLCTQETQQTNYTYDKDTKGQHLEMPYPVKI